MNETDVLAERDPKIARLELERDPLRILDEDATFYTGLGTLLESSVRGIVREWEARG